MTDYLNVNKVTSTNMADLLVPLPQEPWPELPQTDDWLLKSKWSEETMLGWTAATMDRYLGALQGHNGTIPKARKQKILEIRRRLRNKESARMSRKRKAAELAGYKKEIQRQKVKIAKMTKDMKYLEDCVDLMKLGNVCLHCRIFLESSDLMCQELSVSW